MAEEEVMTGTEPVAEPTAEEQPVVETGVETPETQATDEPVDDMGVPIRNRLAEANRKLARAEKLLNQTQAQEELLNPVDQDEAYKIVRGLAQEEAKKMMEPILAKQFLSENPDAVEMIEDINRIRAQYPEISSVDKLEVAYKIAKAEMQDELVKKQSEVRAKELQEKQLKANQSTVEGAGKLTAPAMSIADRMKNATTVKELKELEALLK
jgi:hypothetical protein